MKLVRLGIIGLPLLGLAGGSAWGAEDAASAEAINILQLNLNIVWTCVAAFLVFFMQAGFAMVEA